ncbi:MAG: aminoglycoside phosphotransferase family protein [Planctomycetes bacterium]|nr:aminoglycoside phosphotransferase family protein [Planctomycetota bacterium]
MKVTGSIALDIEQAGPLTAYLRESGRIAAGESPRVTVLAGGVSNRTVLVERGNGEAWVMKQALAKLRVKADWFSDPARIGREAAGLRWLAELAPPGATAPLLFEDHANHLLAMRAVPRPHDNLKTLFLAGLVDPDHVIQFARLIGTIHRRGWERRGEMARLFDDRSFFESLRIEPYYSYTASRVTDAAAFYADLIAQTRGRRFTVVHGDYSPKNVLVHAGSLVLLDHEVIHFGDPAFDLGFASAHLLSKAHHVVACREIFAAAARVFWKVYLDAIGDVPWAGDLEPIAVRHTLACLLARVAGRSPLEYLGEADRNRQFHAVVAMMCRPPGSVDEMVGVFVNEVSDAGH